MSAARKTAELRTRIGELKPLLTEGFKLLEELQDAAEYPDESGFISKTKKTLRNIHKNNTKRVAAEGELAACLRGIPEQIIATEAKLKIARESLRGSAEKKKDAIKDLGEFAYSYLKLWLTLASLREVETCSRFPRIKEFAKKAKKYYDEIEKADSAITFFISKRNKILLDEEVDEVVRYIDALVSVDVLQRMPQPPSGRGGGRRATRKRRSTRKRRV